MNFQPLTNYIGIAAHSIFKLDIMPDIYADKRHLWMTEDAAS